jgi:hypothetical protein
MQIPKRAKILLFLLVAFTAAIVLVFPVDKGKAAESLLQKGRIAIEAKNTDAIMPLVSLYYSDNLGLSYASLKGAFEYVFSQFNNLRVDYRIAGFTPGKDTSIADILVWASGAGAAGTIDLIGSETAPEPVSILFKRDLFKTKVIGSCWPHRKSGLSGLHGLPGLY